MSVEALGGEAGVGSIDRSSGGNNPPLRTHKMAKQVKVNLAAEFLQQNVVKKEDLYRDIKKQIKQLKDCYESTMMT
ncbi:hypothetical protein Ddye_011842 [Dipteronia dyeriana]|uniref:Uncharacterized protein n=1 Tax=Dipteronia dyeriana TaxID=168575 RepID=A0AAE0CHQ0_9ROSI|nr:hypothetical protein Ddye_011842 [Dipteronia dyeriana]